VHPADARSDALSALLALGYKQNQADKALKAVYQQEYTSEELIKAALKQLA
jgi:Holliday junction DNA helicase RuvA